MFKVIFIFLFSISSFALHAQIASIKANDLDSLLQVKKKPTLVLLSTSWCTYCKAQKAQISKNQNLKNIKEKIYFLDFNAESTSSVLFQEKNYQYRPSGIETGVHEFASFLNNQQHLSYPTWILFDENFKRIFHHNGLLSARQIKELAAAIDKVF